MSWEMVNLGDVATFINGYPFKPTEWATEGLEIIRIQNLTKGSSETNYFKGEVPEKYKIVKGDILISWSATLDIFVWKGNDAWLNQHIFKVVFDKIEIDRQFFIYLIKHILDDMRRAVHGATMQHITKAKFDNLKVPLPPLPIQKRIAEILDAADALKRKDQELLKKYDELAQAIFIDMFGDPVKNEKGWEVGTIRDLAKEVKYGTSKPAEDNGLIPYLRMNNITYSGNWDITNLKYINLEDNEYDKYVVKAGDLIFNRTNSKELVGKTAVFDLNMEMAIAGYLIRLRTNNHGNPYYISSYLNSKHGKKTLLGMCKNIVGMANINAQELQEIRIMIPPVNLQNQFEEKVKQLKKIVLKIEEQVNASNSLFQTLIQKAFKGELVK
ncbi:MAG: restriction endonuclease subunit S [Cyclobacteriaceae bacterium]|jgi:type I restriction enzyme S subunit|nr:restriction endonuclease subunit S [Cytophagales bacterium]MCZ8327800.1 restriction endonuclease subunit S [Cyclobacteriaceae bacterium]